MTDTTSPLVTTSGRQLFWLGCGFVVLGPVAYNLQMLVLHQLFVPWYAPILGTLGVIGMIVAVRQRWSVLRLIVLTVAGLLVAFEWAFLLALSRTPDYAGPTAGQPVPAFAAQRGDGAPFTHRDLLGEPTVLLFFRGRW